MTSLTPPSSVPQPPSTLGSRLSGFAVGVVSTLVVLLLLNSLSTTTVRPASTSPSATAAPLLESLTALTPVPPGREDATIITAYSAFGCGGRCAMPAAARPFRIAFLGDSIMYGNGTMDAARLGSTINSNVAGCWPADVHIFFDARNFAVERSSVSCDMNDIRYHPNFQRLLNFKPDVVVFGMGTNDCHHTCCCRCNVTGFWRPDCIGKCMTNKPCKVPFDSANFVRRYKAMIDAFVAAKKNDTSSVAIVLVTPPPMLDADFVRNHVFQRERINATIVPLIRRIAKQRRLPLVDLHRAMSAIQQGKNATAVDSLILHDGIHPSMRGHRVMASEFFKQLCAQRLSGV